MLTITPHVAPSDLVSATITSNAEEEKKLQAELAVMSYVVDGPD